MRKLLDLLGNRGPHNAERERQKQAAQYFYRRRIFDIDGRVVVALEADGSRSGELDTWAEIVFASADGSITLQRLTEIVGADFPAGMPPEIREALWKAVQQLLFTGFLGLSPKAVELPYYLHFPYSHQNRARAKAMMKEDGFLRER